MKEEQQLLSNTQGLPVSIEHVNADKQYLENPQGYYVPVESIREIDLLRDNLVREKFAKAYELHMAIKQFKQELMQDVDAFVDLSMDRYNVKLGGKKRQYNLALL